MIVDARRIKFGKKSYLIELSKVTKEKPHYHTNAVELILVLKGKVTITSSSESGAFEEGDILSFDTQDIHYSSSEEDNLFVSFYFNTQSPVFSDYQLSEMAFFCTKYAPEHMLFLREKMRKLKSMMLDLLLCHYCPDLIPSGFTKGREEQAMELVRYLVEHFEFVTITGELTSHSMEMQKRLSMIQRYLRKNYQEKITLQSLAEYAHMDANYLSQIFKYVDEDGFKSFLSRLRVYFAQHYLVEENDMSMAQISYACGFSDPKFFYREFKKNLYGVTPYQWLKKIREYSKEAEPNIIYDVKDISNFRDLLLREFFEVSIDM